MANLKRIMMYLVLVISPLGYAQEKPGAIILLSSSNPEDLTTRKMLSVLKQQVSSTWQIMDVSSVVELARVDPVCTDGHEKERLKETIVADVREGLRLFFDETALDASRELLTKATNAFFEHPCIFGDLPDERTEVCAGAVVLARILLLSEPELSAAVARRIALVFSAEEVQAHDVPPEIARFLKGIRLDVEMTKAEVEIEVQPEVREAALFIDGRKVTSSKTALAAGSHEVSLRLADGLALSRRVVTGNTPVKVHFDVVLAGALRPSQEGCLILGGLRAQDPIAVARRVSELTGLVAILAAEKHGGGLSVTAVTPSGQGPELMTIEPESTRKFGVTFTPDSPILAKEPWPWPFVTAGVSVALLAAAVGLNVGANQAAASINDGENQLLQWRAMYYSSIACYTLAAAGATTTVLLFVFRPSPSTHLVIEEDSL